MVIDFDGPPCQGNCPSRGCLETFASGTALGREGLEAAATRAGFGARPGARRRAGRSTERR